MVKNLWRSDKDIITFKALKNIGIASEKTISKRLKMATAEVVETSVTVKNNSPIQDYVHPDDHFQTTHNNVFFLNIILVMKNFAPFITFFTVHVEMQPSHSGSPVLNETDQSGTGLPFGA